MSRRQDAAPTAREGGRDLVVKVRFSFLFLFLFLFISPAPRGCGVSVLGMPRSWFARAWGFCRREVGSGFCCPCWVVERCDRVVVLFLEGWILHLAGCM